jgi:hypothetical protein
MVKVSREGINPLHAEVCQPLADPTRIALVHELSHGEKNVGERIIAALDLLREVLAQIMTTHKMLAEALK